MTISDEMEASLHEALLKYYETESVKTIANRVGVSYNTARRRADGLKTRGLLPDTRKPMPPCGPRPQRPTRICSVPGCGEPHKAYGLCRTHYRHAYTDPRLTARRREKTPREIDRSTDGWVAAAGFPGYEVHHTGVLRNDRFWLLSQHHTPAGRKQAKLTRDKGQRSVLVHRLVLESFMGPPPLGTVACHRDGNPLNNNLDNLYWGTASDNQQDSLRHGTHFFARRDSCSRGHKYVEGSYWVHGGARKCKECQYIRRAKHLAKKRANKPISDIDLLPEAI